MAQTYVGHSKSIVKSWLGILLAQTLTLVGLLAEIICTDETTNHLSLVPFKQSIHDTDLTKLTRFHGLGEHNHRIYIPKRGRQE